MNPGEDQQIMWNIKLNSQLQSDIKLSLYGLALFRVNLDYLMLTKKRVNLKLY